MSVQVAAALMPDGAVGVSSRGGVEAGRANKSLADLVREFGFFAYLRCSM
jgi:hypothetical protein